ncbi:MAG: lytic transglycosylase domain-containing protein [Deltaproteobacteria bacterium]|nr:lytic transglycosylase domain-containing protein [Deltaproteobacteria bacterium]
MSEDVPLHRHTVLMGWIGCLGGAVMLLIIPGLIHYYSHLHVPSGVTVSITASSQTTERNQSPYTKAQETDPLFRSIIQEASDLYEVEPELIQAIIMAESSYNPRAVSKRGARGLMQLMPATAKALGVEDSFNPEHNIHGGVRYFRQLLDRFGGDVKMALAAYNAGSRKVREYQGIPPFKSTKYYITRVFSYYNHYKEADRV